MFLVILPCRKLKLEETVASIWPEFGSNRKDLIKVNNLNSAPVKLHNLFCIAVINVLFAF